MSTRNLKSVRLAEELRELQDYGELKLAEQGVVLTDVTAITRRVLKGREWATGVGGPDPGHGMRRHHRRRRL